MNNNFYNKEFLQSREWEDFQKSLGKETYFIKFEDYLEALLVLEKMPIVGSYFYVPRGPLIKIQETRYKIQNNDQKVKIQDKNVDISNQDDNKGEKSFLNSLVDLAIKHKVFLVRMEPRDEESLEIIRNSLDYKIVKAPRDVQPGEIFVMDITLGEEELLAQMKSKTRYNIRLAKKKGVEVISIDKNHSEIEKYKNIFINLIQKTSSRKGIKSHPASYYEKMIESLPENVLKLYLAKYEDKIIAANLMIFYEDTAIYLHGGADNEFRNVMAPFLLQWQAILDAKNRGCRKYDLGGVKTQKHSSANWRTQNTKTQKHDYNKNNEKDKSSDWVGITRFKEGFSPGTESIEFPGTWDIVVDGKKYWLYKFLRKLRNFA